MAEKPEETINPKPQKDQPSITIRIQEGYVPPPPQPKPKTPPKKPSPKS